MKTSKIKEIKNISEHTNNYGTTYYHHCIMENGDKIDIGKKKQMQVGWEITYEFVGEVGQHEFTKVKAVKPEGNFNAPKKDDNYVKGIEVGHAINNAVNMLCAGLVFDDIDTPKTENKIYLYAKKIMSISETLKNE